MTGVGDVEDPDLVERLLGSDRVTPPTRAVLEARLRPTADQPEFLSEELYGVLVAICARLIPQTDAARRVDVAQAIDARLMRGDGDGWRYDALPCDGQAYREGLAAVDRAARNRCGAAFVDLDGGAQDRALGLCQSGELVDDLWTPQAWRRWFEEVSVEAAAIYYSHPWAQSRIGYFGMADAHGWTAIGLDAHERAAPTAGGGS